MGNVCPCTELDIVPTALGAGRQSIGIQCTTCSSYLFKSVRSLAQHCTAFAIFTFGQVRYQNMLTNHIHSELILEGWKLVSSVCCLQSSGFKVGGCLAHVSAPYAVSCRFVLSVCGTKGRVIATPHVAKRGHPNWRLVSSVCCHKMLTHVSAPYAVSCRFFLLHMRAQGPCDCNSACC